MTRHRLSRLAAAVLVTAAAGLTVVGVAAPAGAATCSTSSGVTVLVDFKQLGGGVQGTCVAAGAGQRASALFPAAGFALTYAQNEPGFICRVSGLPTKDDEPCVDTAPATAYWGLWWSDGKSGSWSYSSYGVGTLKVPDGGYVAFAWKQGTGDPSSPGVSPAVHPAATPTPTTAPSPTPTRTPSASPTVKPTPSQSSAPSSSATESVSAPVSESTAASASPSASPTESTSPSESESPTPTATETSSGPVVQEPAEPTGTEAVSSSEGGIPLVLVLVLIAALFAAAAGAVVLRRRRA